MLRAGLGSGVSSGPQRSKARPAVVAARHVAGPHTKIAIPTRLAATHDDREASPDALASELAQLRARVERAGAGSGAARKHEVQKWRQQAAELTERIKSLEQQLGQGTTPDATRATPTFRLASGASPVEAAAFAGRIAATVMAVQQVAHVAKAIGTTQLALLPPPPLPPTASTPAAAPPQKSDQEQEVHESMPEMDRLEPGVWQERWLRAGGRTPRPTALFRGANNTLTSLSFDPSGSLLASGHCFGWQDWEGFRVIELNVRGGKPMPTLPPHSDKIEVSSCSYSPDGKYVAIATVGDYTYQAAKPSVIAVFDATTGARHWVAPVSQEAQWDAEIAHKDQHGMGDYSVRDITALTWSPCSRYIVAGGKDGSCRVWDVAAGQPVAILDHTDRHEEGDWYDWDPEHGTVVRATYNAAGSLLATITKGGALRVWAASLGHKLMGTEHLKGSSCDVAWLPDGRTLVVNSMEPGSNPASRRPTHDVPRGFTTQQASSPSFNPSFDDGYTFPAAPTEAPQAGLHLLDAYSLQAPEGFESMPPTDGRTAEVTRLAVAPAGALSNMLVTGSRDGSVRVWDMTSWECVHELLAGPSPNACSTAGQAVTLCEAEEAGPGVYEVIGGPKQEKCKVVSLTVSSTGVVAAGTASRGVWVWQPPAAV